MYTVVHEKSYTLIYKKSYTLVYKKSHTPVYKKSYILTLSVLIFAGSNFRENKISRELIREILEEIVKFAKFCSHEIKKKSAFAKIREI